MVLTDELVVYFFKTLWPKGWKLASNFVAVDKKSIPNDENKSYFSQVLATFIKVGATTFTRVAKHLAHQGTVIIFG